MTYQEKMIQAKLRFRDATRDLFLHLNDEDPLWDYETKLQAATNDYWQALYNLARNQPDDINPSYKKVIEDQVVHLRSQVFFLTQSIEDYRKQQGLET